MGTFTVDGWRTTGQTTIDGGNITAGTITADAIKTSTLNAKTITLGTTGGDSIIKSGNYDPGVAGWQIKANGDAEFNNVTVRGTIATSTIGSGAVITVNGLIESENFVSGSEGWQLGYDGRAYFKNITAVGSIEAGTELISVGDITAESDIWIAGVVVLSSDISSASAHNRSIYTTNGTTLYWKDAGGTSHALY
jgi:hypothetical protein